MDKRESTGFLLSFSFPHQKHCGKIKFLQNIEMNLKFNPGPLHFLDNFVKEILASD